MVGDIGGTKTTIAIFAVESGPRQILIQQTYPSKDYPSLDAIVMAFIADKLGVDQALSGAVFGVAGPVLGTRAQVTNLPWLIDAGTLSQAMHCPVKLLNDLEAIASAVPYLTADDLETLNVGSPVAEATIAVIAPGTGLGEAYLTWDGTGYRAHPSEGGHADFAPTTTLELALLTALQPKFGHVSYARARTGLADCRAVPGGRSDADYYAGGGKQYAHCADRPANARPVHNDSGGRSKQSGLENAGNRRYLPGRWHPATYPAAIESARLHDLFYEQGTLC